MKQEDTKHTGSKAGRQASTTAIRLTDLAPREDVVGAGTGRKLRFGARLLGSTRRGH